MKRKTLQKKTLLLLTMMLVGIASVWAQDVTYNFATFTSAQTVTFKADNENITITLDKTSSGSSNPAWVSNEARLYAKGTMSVAAASKKIAKIVYTYTVNANKSGKAPTIDSVKGSTSEGTWDAENKTWTGSDNTVTMTTSGDAGNIGFTKLEIWYENETPDPGDTRDECPIALDKSELALDVYNNATAQLTATSASTGAITWQSSDATVATVDAEGNVTALKAGTATITASQAADENYKAGNATCALTVTDSTPYEQPLSFDIPLNGGSESFNNGSTSGSTTDEVSLTKNRVKLTYTRNGSSLYTANGAIRFYKSNTLKFEAPDGYNITSITLTQSNTQTDDITADGGEWDKTNHKWTGAASSVTLSRPSDASSYMQLTNAAITLAKPSSIATPTFSVAAGNYVVAQNVEISCATDGATIYYTLDGTTPTDASTEYTGAIAINATTTLKAIAIKGEESSAVASATYTFPTIYADIAAFKAANTTGYLNVEGAQVVYIDDAKKNIYVRDASGAIDLFNNSGFSTDLKTGDILGGVLYGKYSPYKNLPEIASVDLDNVTVTGTEVVVAKVIEGTTAAIQANLCDLVKIENTEITESSSKYYVGDDSDIQLYDNFSVGYTVTTGKAVDVSGIATVYNTTYELFPRFESDIVYLDNSVAVEVSANGYATFCSEKALDFTGVDAIHVYIATVEGNTVNFTRVKKIPADTGVLLRSSEGGAVDPTNVPVLDGDAEDVSTNKLVAATEEIASLASTDAEGNANYILNKVNGVIGFYKANNQKVAAGKAYLQLDAATAKNMTFIGFGDETSVNEELRMENEELAPAYNLAGQRVDAGFHGTVIQNGKKVIR